MYTQSNSGTQIIFALYSVFWPRKYVETLETMLAKAQSLL